MPVFRITFKLSPKPKNTTASCRMYFDVNEMPSSNLSRDFQKTAIIIPKIIAIIGPPITGIKFPTIKDGTAIIRHIIMP